MISCPRPSAGRYISGSDHRTAPIIIFYRAGPPAHEVAPSIYRSGSCGDGVARSAMHQLGWIEGRNVTVERG
jgi:hypothetical protein